MTDYLKEQDLLEILTRYRSNKKDANEFIEAITLIANNLIRKYTFYARGVAKEDFIQEAVMVCLERQHCFRKDKGHCFSYFTTVIINHWKHLWNSDRRYYDIIALIIEQALPEYHMY